jgi:hypothetical protein
MKELACGCRLVDMITGANDAFPANCQGARILESKIRQAIREKDWVGMRTLGEQLARHRAGQQCYIAENPVATRTKEAAG